MRSGLETPLWNYHDIGSGKVMKVDEFTKGRLAEG